MLKINYKKTLAFLISFSLLIPFFILFAGEIGGAGAPTITNPLGTDSVKVLLLRIMNLVASVGAIVVVFFIIYSGYKFVTAGDSDTDRTKAKDIFFSTVIGGAILLGADVIANVVVNTVKATTGVLK